MPLLLPIVLCIVGVVIAMLPPADVQPDEGRSSWLGMAIATIAVVSVIVFAVHQLRANDPAERGSNAEVAGNPSGP